MTGPGSTATVGAKPEIPHGHEDPSAGALRRGGGLCSGGSSRLGPHPGTVSIGQISISERTYEIGLRKSIGATDPEIFGQFLIESVSLSLVGDLVGAAVGCCITMMAVQAFPDSLSVSPLGLFLAAAFAIVIGGNRWG